MVHDHFTIEQMSHALAGVYDAVVRDEAELVQRAEVLA